MRLRKLEKPTDILKKYDPEDLIIEEKYDGFKVLVTINEKVRLYTRRGVEFTRNIPEITKELAHLPKGIWLLGELTYIINKKQILAGVQSIVNATPEHALKQDQKNLRLIIYDILKYRNKNITNIPLIERKKILKTLSRTKNIYFAPFYSWKNWKNILKKSLKNGGEGIVIKPKHSIYLIRPYDEIEPHGEWYKYKKTDTEDVILTSYFFHHKMKKAIFRACQMKNGKLFEVGKLSGLDGITAENFMNRIDKGENIIVEVEYQEKFPSGKIRSMVFVRDRSIEKKS